MTRGGRNHTARGMALTPGLALALLVLAGPGAVGSAGAQTFGSSYTSAAPRDCRVTHAGNGVDDSAIRACPGKAGAAELALRR
jgi:hypothetical protein